MQFPAVSCTKVGALDDGRHPTTPQHLQTELRKLLTCRLIDQPTALFADLTDCLLVVVALAAVHYSEGCFIGTVV